MGLGSLETTRGVSWISGGAPDSQASGARVEVFGEREQEEEGKRTVQPKVEGRVRHALDLEPDLA